MTIEDRMQTLLHPHPLFEEGGRWSVPFMGGWARGALKTAKLIRASVHTVRTNASNDNRGRQRELRYQRLEVSARNLVRALEDFLEAVQ